VVGVTANQSNGSKIQIVRLAGEEGVTSRNWAKGSNVKYIYLRADRASAGLVSALSQILVPDILGVNWYRGEKKQLRATVDRAGSMYYSHPAGPESFPSGDVVVPGPASRGRPTGRRVSKRSSGISSGQPHGWTWDACPITASAYKSRDGVSLR